MIWHTLKKDLHVMVESVDYVEDYVGDRYFTKYWENPTDGSIADYLSDDEEEDDHEEDEQEQDPRCEFCDCEPSEEDHLEDCEALKCNIDPEDYELYDQ